MCGNMEGINLEFRVIDNGWKEGMAEEEYLLVNGVGIRKFGIFGGRALTRHRGVAGWRSAGLAGRRRTLPKEPG